MTMILICNMKCWKMQYECFGQIKAPSGSLYRESSIRWYKPWITILVRALCLFNSLEQNNSVTFFCHTSNMSCSFHPRHNNWAEIWNRNWSVSARSSWKWIEMIQLKLPKLISSTFNRLWQKCLGWVNDVQVHIVGLADTYLTLFLSWLEEHGGLTLSLD